VASAGSNEVWHQPDQMKCGISQKRVVPTSRVKQSVASAKKGWWQPAELNKVWHQPDQKMAINPIERWQSAAVKGCNQPK
jgi:hypothetical protein